MTWPPAGKRYANIAFPANVFICAPGLWEPWSGEAGACFSKPHPVGMRHDPHPVAARRRRLRPELPVRRGTQRPVHAAPGARVHIEVISELPVPPGPRPET